MSRGESSRPPCAGAGEGGGLGDVGRAEPLSRRRRRRDDAFRLRFERFERSGVKRDAEEARGLDEAGFAGLGREREHPPLALWRARFRERPERERRDRLARNAAAAADPDGDEPRHGLTNRHCTTGIAARQPEKRPTRLGMRDRDLRKLPAVTGAPVD